jgi:hypothetical protein
MFKIQIKLKIYVFQPPYIYNQKSAMPEEKKKLKIFQVEIAGADGGGGNILNRSASATLLFM